MGIKVSPNSKESQGRRQKIKTLGQQMKRVAVEGAGLSPWEADVLVKAIDEIYFSDPDLRELSSGQLRYSCVSISEGPGKPLHECAMETVTLSLFNNEEDGKDLPFDGKSASVERRYRKIMRLTEEAREQNGLLTQEDLAELLHSDVRTIRRAIKALGELGIIVSTRGQQKDIGPGVSHRGLAVRLWLEGLEPVDIASRIKHSVSAVENYLEKFKRIAYLRRKNFDDYETALTVGISVFAVKTFVEIYHESKNKPFFKSRLDEIELVGERHYFAQDEKKESILSSGFMKGGKAK